ILVEKLPDRARCAAAPGSKDPKAKPAQLGQKLPAACEGENHLLPETRHAVEKRPELTVRDAEKPRFSLGDGCHDHPPGGQNIDGPGKAPRLVDRDYAVGVPRVTDLELAGFHDIEVDVRLAGSKDDVPISVVARFGEALHECQFSDREARKSGFFSLSHGE